MGHLDREGCHTGRHSPVTPITTTTVLVDRVLTRPWDVVRPVSASSLARPVWTSSFDPAGYASREKSPYPSLDSIRTERFGICLGVESGKWCL